jgi:hypothetical protein
VRAEFGRSILEDVDGTGLAFNCENARSEGWEKNVLLRQLSANYGRHDNFRFTKILSTYGSDVESMINTKINGTQLWRQHPSRVWTTYSFHCLIVQRSSLGSSKSTHAENPIGFILDVDDNASSANPFSYSIRPSNHGRSADGLMPVYIHAIRRHWDLRIALSHTNTEELERVFGSFGRTVLQSLSVSYVMAHLYCPILQEC